LAQEAFDPERVQLRRAERATVSIPENPTSTVTIGVVVHDSEKYVVPCIQSLFTPCKYL